MTNRKIFIMLLIISPFLIITLLLIALNNEIIPNPLLFTFVFLIFIILAMSFSYLLFIIPFRNRYFTFVDLKTQILKNEISINDSYSKKVKTVWLGKEEKLKEPSEYVKLFENGFIVLKGASFEGKLIPGCKSIFSYSDIIKIYEIPKDKRTFNIRFQIQTKDFRTFLIWDFNSNKKGKENIIDQLIEKLKEKIGDNWTNIYFTKPMDYSMLHHHDEVPLDWNKNWKKYRDGIENLT